MPAAMGSNSFNGSSDLDSTIKSDYVMIATPVKTSLSMPCVYIGHMEVPARLCGGAVDYNSVNMSHSLSVLLAC